MFDITQIQNTVKYIADNKLMFDQRYTDRCILFYMSHGHYKYALANLVEYFPGATEEEIESLKQFFEFRSLTSDWKRESQNLEAMVKVFNLFFGTNVTVNQ